MWKKIKDKVKDKRTKNAKTCLQDGQQHPKGELIVQHLSAHVSGKAQKYACMNSFLYAVNQLTSTI